MKTERSFCVGFYTDSKITCEFIQRSPEVDVQSYTDTIPKGSFAEWFYEMLVDKTAWDKNKAALYFDMMGVSVDVIINLNKALRADNDGVRCVGNGLLSMLNAVSLQMMRQWKNNNRKLETETPAAQIMYVKEHEAFLLPNSHKFVMDGPAVPAGPVEMVASSRVGAAIVRDELCVATLRLYPGVKVVIRSNRNTLGNAALLANMVVHAALAQ